MNQLFRRITVWLALAGLFGLIMLVRATTSTPPMPAPPVAPAAKPFQRGIGASGIIEALRENTNIGVPFGALVDDVPVKVWDRVTKGTPLLRLDDRELRSKLISLRAELKVRQAELAKARREFNRNTELHDARVGTRADFENRQDELAIATARIAATEAAVSETESLLERFIIRAPIDGTILQINIRSGEQAMPGTSTAPIVLGSIDVLQVRADVDEQLAPRIANGARAVAYRKGSTKEPIALEFVRIEPFIVPKKNLTGSSSERVDTRVLPVIFRFAGAPAAGTYVGQQVDVFIEE